KAAVSIPAHSAATAMPPIPEKWSSARTLPPPLTFAPEYSAGSRSEGSFPHPIHDEDGHLVHVPLHPSGSLSARVALSPHLLPNRDLRSLAPNKVDIFQRDIYLQAAFHLCPSGGFEGGGHH